MTSRPRVAASLVDGARLHGPTRQVQGADGHEDGSGEELLHPAVGPDRGTAHGQPQL